MKGRIQPHGVLRRGGVRWWRDLLRLHALVEQQLHLLTLGEVFVEVLTQLVEHGLLLLAQRAALREARDQVCVDLLEADEAIEEVLLARSVLHLIHLRGTARPCRSTGTAAAVELQPLDAIRVRCRLAGSHAHASSGHLLLGQAGDALDDLQGVQQRRLEDHGARRVPELRHQLREVGGASRRPE